MTYNETIAYLYASAPLFQQVGAGAYKEGLETTYALDEHFGHPHRQYRTIHVAGTNGKGSCAHTLASMLRHKGLRVGLYTSPHLVEFRERIRVDGEMIPEQYVVDFVENHRAFFEPLHPSFFELTTALAFRYFANAEVDVAVVEVGLGGRLDCTNIITPVLSLITNISLDHTQFLGKTLAAIAGEKAGIIKPGVPAVVGEALPETEPVFRKKAKEADAPLFFAEQWDDLVAYGDGQDGKKIYVSQRYGTFEGELAGDCQVHNTRTLLCAARQLEDIFGLTADDVRHGFAHVCEDTGLMGRWQTLSERPLVVCDTGHNAGGWQYLSSRLRAETYSHAKVRVVFGMAADKDVEGVMESLPREAEYYWCRASVKRALDENALAAIALRHCLHGRSFATVPEAVKAALADSSRNDFVYIGGSSFVVADWLSACAAEKD